MRNGRKKMERRKNKMENKHHLFNKKEIRDNLVKVFGEPKTDEEHKKLCGIKMKIWKGMPQFKIDEKQHYELTYNKEYHPSEFNKDLINRKKDRQIKRIIHLEQHCKRQKHYITQLLATKKELEFLFNSKKKEALSDLSELWNNIDDDLTMDKEGEFGYKNEKEVVKAIKKYTLSVLKRKIKKWEKFVKLLPIKEFFNKKKPKDKTPKQKEVKK